MIPVNVILSHYKKREIQEEILCKILMTGKVAAKLEDSLVKGRCA